ncbi:endo-beta-N-acetylglucosaminidase [Flagelloscypha sp. PMI_526]|nr:endo-beta-N-acetylglucosaminidase [Flagelloscypha sp. PMI_526]
MVSPRVIMYYQTHKRNGEHVSPLPLLGYITHLFLAAFHLNMGNVGPDIVHLNDFMPSDPYFAQVWPDIATMQHHGVKVIGMLGGAAPGTYDCLSDELFDTYYPPLRDVIEDYHLDGMDLDVEQWISPDVITRILGPHFIITLAPVASALTQGGNLSGFDYCRFGTKLRTSDKLLVALLLTNPNNGGGYINLDQANYTISELNSKYGKRWGGVGGWEYFNSLPDESEPWLFAKALKAAIDAKPHTATEQSSGVEPRVKSRFFRGMETEAF